MMMVTDEGLLLLVIFTQSFALASKGEDGNVLGNSCMKKRELSVMGQARKSSGVFMI